MFNLNRAMVLGNSTRDVDFRTTPNGRSVGSFAVATNRRWKDQASGELKEEVQYHEIVVWGKLAEIAKQIIRRGTKVYVEGRLQTRTWEGQDGNRREKTEIVAENLISLSGRSGGEPYEESQSRGETPAPEKPEKEEKSEKPAEKKEKNIEDEINLDDIPF